MEIIEVSEQNQFEIDDLQKFKSKYDGYKKVTATLLMSALGLPIWRTLIFKDADNKNIKSVKEFMKEGSEYFMRTDTYMGHTDNRSFTGNGEELIEKIHEFKKIEDRYILILEVPAIQHEEYKNLGSCRAGVFDGVETQEWVGPGFYEFHLGKDKFPHTAKLHTVVEYLSNKPKTIFQGSQEQICADIDQLLWSIGISELKLKHKFHDHKVFFDLTGKQPIKKEPVNDELILAYEKWREKSAKDQNKSIVDVDKDIRKIGEDKLLRMGEGEAELLKLRDQKNCNWKPTDKQIELVHKMIAEFKKNSEKYGIDSNEVILTFSLNIGSTSKDIICWDIFNLNI